MKNEWVKSDCFASNNMKCWKKLLVIHSHLMWMTPWLVCRTLAYYSRRLSRFSARFLSPYVKYWPNWSSTESYCRCLSMIPLSWMLENVILKAVFWQRCHHEIDSIPNHYNSLPFLQSMCVGTLVLRAMLSFLNQVYRLQAMLHIANVKKKTKEQNEIVLKIIFSKRGLKNTLKWLKKKEKQKPKISIRCSYERTYVLKTFVADAVNLNLNWDSRMLAELHDPILLFCML